MRKVSRNNFKKKHVIFENTLANNIVRQGFLYEDEILTAKDVNYTFYKDFVKKFLIEYKIKFQKKYGIVKNFNPNIINNIKIIVDKILNTFKKRVTYKKNTIFGLQKKYITNNFKDVNISESYTKLIDYILFLNKNIVNKFLQNIIKPDDMDKALSLKEEFGFDVQSAFDWSSDLLNNVSKYFDNTFNDLEKDDIKFELDRGYFTDIYNEYSDNKNPTKEDLNQLKLITIERVKQVSLEIENTFHKKIENTKNKITTEKITKYLTLDEK